MTRDTFIRDPQSDAEPRLRDGYVDPRDLTLDSPLEQLARAYLQDQADRARSVRTLEKYDHYLRGLLRFIGWPKQQPRIRELDVRTLRAYSSWLSRRHRNDDAEDQPIGPATKNLHLSALRGMLRFGRLIDLEIPGPEKVERAREPEVSPDARHLEAEALERLLEAHNGGTPRSLAARALLEFLYATGCRVSEAVAVDRAQVELTGAARPPDGSPVVDELTVFGKGGRHRRVYLTERVRTWLARYIGSRKDGDPALFVTERRKPRAGYRMSVRQAQLLVEEAARRAGIPHDVSPHWLRHSAISTWTSVLGLTAAQRLAGHRSIATTNRYLGGSDAELKRLYRERMG